MGKKDTVGPTRALGLPPTRMRQFREVLRYRFTAVVGVSLCTFAFALPLVVWLVFADYSLLTAGAGLLDLLLAYGVAAPLVGLAGVGFGGACGYFKRLLWNQGTALLPDFSRSLKAHGLAFGGCFFGLGIMLVVLQIYFAAVAGLDSLYIIARGFLLGAAVVFFFLFSSVSLWMALQTLLYDLPFGSLLSNGLRFCFGFLPRNIGLGLLVFWPLAVAMLFPYAAVQWSFVALIAVFHGGWAALIYTSKAVAVFDRVINAGHYPAVYRRGLDAGEQAEGRPDGGKNPDREKQNGNNL